MRRASRPAASRTERVTRPSAATALSNDCPPDLPKLNGTSCSDGAFCNGLEECRSGACAASEPACPGACDETTDSCTGCPAVAQSCRSAGKSLLVAKQPDDAARHKLIWKWLRGAKTLQPEFGDPRDATQYLLCFYGGAAQTLIPGSDISVPADATRWAPIGLKGFKYADATQASDGVQKVALKSGGDGKAKTMLIGKGAALPSLTLPLTPAQFPLTVQLLNGSRCWSSTFTGADHNDASGLKAKN